MFTKKQYLNYNGIFDKKWRDCNSTWATLTPKELKDTKNIIKEMIQNKTIKEYISEREKLRKKVGQTTIILATKS